MVNSIPTKTVKSAAPVAAFQSLLSGVGVAVAATGLTLAASSLVPAQAVQFGFSNITGNSATNAATGESQLFLDVTEDANGDALFTFSNAGPDASS